MRPVLSIVFMCLYSSLSGPGEVLDILLSLLVTSLLVIGSLRTSLLLALGTYCYDRFLSLSMSMFFPE